MFFSSTAYGWKQRLVYVLIGLLLSVVGKIVLGITLGRNLTLLSDFIFF